MKKIFPPLALLMQMSSGAGSALSAADLTLATIQTLADQAAEAACS